MNDISKISLALIELEKALRKSKNPAADYFNSLRIRIEQNTADRNRLIEEEILRASSVIQYGNFSYEEERLFNVLWDYADKYRQGWKH